MVVRKEKAGRLVGESEEGRGEREDWDAID
jgi:hypothetical protein